VKRTGLALISLLAAAVLVGSPALAARKGAHHAVPCSKIKDAIAAGKTPEDVAKEMNVSAARVKSCTAPPKSSGKKAAPKKAS
jgi:hypothetical protein